MLSIEAVAEPLLFASTMGPDPVMARALEWLANHDVGKQSDPLATP